MSRFFHAHEIAKPKDVLRYLTGQERHWKKGYSAYELAHSWVHADNIPAPVRSVLDTCPDCAGAALVEGLFERDVDLRTRGGRSQTDLLAFVKFVHGYAVIAVEGRWTSRSMILFRLGTTTSVGVGQGSTDQVVRRMPRPHRGRSSVRNQPPKPQV